MLFLFSNATFSQFAFYYAYDEQIILQADTGKYVVSYQDGQKSDIQQQLTNIVISNGNLTAILWDEFNNYCIINSTQNIQQIKTSLNINDIRAIQPLYKTTDGAEMIITDEIVVKFKNNISQSTINQYFDSLNVVVKKVTSQFYIVAVTLNTDALEVANIIQESGLVIFSHPDFISKTKKHQMPIDPYFINQYYLHNVGQTTANGYSGTSGADINAPEAWDITKGSSNIVVAVLDDGVVRNHPDLPDTRQVIFPLTIYDIYPYATTPIGDDNHGTACAGIIAASHNNEGIAGIAPNCKIMPIRMPFGNVPSSIYASAITYAKEHGADIISNSWGYETYSPNAYPDIVEAIRDATLTGRSSNKGCVVVFSSGNSTEFHDYDIITFPANVTIDGVLTVGASDRNDEQAVYSPTSNLSSPYNQIIDIVAPSNKAYSCNYEAVVEDSPTETRDVWTLDIPNEAGDNPVKERDCYDGELPIIGTILPDVGTNYLAYTGTFGGTSAACPQVSAVAALILSINPNLTQKQVSDTILSTARKAGNYNYQITSGIDNGTWNAQMGHGVLNAYAAVQAAVHSLFANLTMNGHSNINVCDVNTYTVSGTTQSYWLNWRLSSNLNNYVVIEVGGNSSTARIRAVQGASSAISGTIYCDIIYGGHTFTLSKNITVNPGTAGYTNIATENFTITSNTTWNTASILGVIATVAPGVTLTITDSVKCTSNAKIIVGTDATLALIGATLTNTCGEMWQGIEVCNYPYSNTNQTWAVQMNNSLIENAVCAIKTTMTGPSRRAASLRADNSTFKNNSITLNFSENHVDGNIASNFNNCTFLTNANYMGSATVTPNDHIFVKMYKNKGKIFSKCSFTNTSPQSWRGIVAEDAGFKVQELCAPNSPIYNTTCYLCDDFSPSSFKGLIKAIDVNNTGSQYTFLVKRTNFSSNNSDIVVGSTDNYLLALSNFDIPSTSLRSTQSLLSSSSSGYTISENHFYFTPTKPLSYFGSAVVISNSGIADNLLNNNTFHNVDKAVAISANNGTDIGSNDHGLQITCNTFTGNNIDITLSQNSTIKLHQGSNLKGADNDFKSTYTSSIKSLGAQQITYHYSNASNHAPINPTLAYVSPAPNAGTNACISNICDSISSHNALLLAQYQNLQEEYEQASNSNEMMLRHEISNAMRDLSNMQIHKLKIDSLPHLDELKQWYSIINTPIAKYSLAETNFELKNYAEAENVLAEIPAMFEFGDKEQIEHNNYLDFHNFKKNLIDSERSYYDLTDAELTNLKQIAGTGNGRSATMAKGVLCFFYGICLEDEEENFEEGGEIFYAPAQQNSSPEEEIAEENNIVYPNPTNNFIYFDNFAKKSVSLHNSNGILLETTRESFMDLSKYSAGTYFLNINSKMIKVVKK